MKYASALWASLVSGLTCALFVAALVGGVGVAADGDDADLGFLGLFLIPMVGITVVIGIVNIVILKTSKGEPSFLKITPMVFIEGFMAEFCGVSTKKQD